MDTDRESGYVAGIMDIFPVRIELADENHLDALAKLLQVIEAEDRPEDAEAALRAPEGVRQSLRHFDALNSDCVWLLIAFFGDQPAGLAVLTRIPKLDARLGFLYLDELHVIHEYRRQGIGKLLLARCIELSQELGLAGIRLLARIDNEPARRLYESMDFRGNETMLYQFRFDPSSSQP
jgi:ribosomal protein S18 acetylase RimI-like enzyme